MAVRLILAPIPAIAVFFVTIFGHLTAGGQSTRADQRGVDPGMCSLLMKTRYFSIGRMQKRGYAAALTDRRASQHGHWPRRYTAPRRPVIRLITKITKATTRSKWIRLPPILKLNPRSHRIKHTAIKVQSIVSFRAHC